MISCFSEIDIAVDTFMDVLDNGVYLCEIAKIIETKAKECVAESTVSGVSVT